MNEYLLTWLVHYKGFKEEERKREGERLSLSILGLFNFVKSKVKSQFRDEIEREWNVQSV